MAKGGERFRNLAWQSEDPQFRGEQADLLQDPLIIPCQAWRHIAPSWAVNRAVQKKQYIKIGWFPKTQGGSPVSPLKRKQFWTLPMAIKAQRLQNLPWITMQDIILSRSRGTLWTHGVGGFWSGHEFSLSDKHVAKCHNRSEHVFSLSWGPIFIDMFITNDEQNQQIIRRSILAKLLGWSAWHSPGAGGWYAEYHQHCPAIPRSTSLGLHMMADIWWHLKSYIHKYVHIYIYFFWKIYIVYI